MRNASGVVLTALLVGALATTGLAVVQPDSMIVVVPGPEVTGPSTGAIGAAGYDPTNDVYYTVLFSGDRLLRRYDPLVGTAVTYVNDSDLSRLGRSSDVPGGLVSTNDTGTLSPSGLVLNPATLVIGGITYPPYTIAYVIDMGTVVMQGGTTERKDWTKKMYRYDLRQIGAATSAQPDRANAQDGNGNIIGSLGIADWNDVFSVVFTEGDLNTVSGQTGSDNIGRQFCWSSDGQSLYFVETSTSFGGVWKVDAVTGALTWVFQDTASANVIAEPACIHTSVRDFTGGTLTGDQIFFDGTAASSNVGGVSFIVDNGGTISGPFVALSQAEIEQTVEWNGEFMYRQVPAGQPDPGVNPDQEPGADGLEFGPDGSLYIYMTPSSYQSVLRYDRKGRLACVKSKFQHQLFNGFLTNSSPGATGCTTYRMQIHNMNVGGVTVPRIMYQQVTGKAVGGILAYKTGDFDRDGVRGPADIAIFNAKKALPIETIMYTSGTNDRYYEAVTDGAGAPLKTADEVAFEAYLRCDLNGNSLVTAKDEEILRKFFPHDYDLDGDVDLADFGGFLACFNGPNRPAGQPGCESSDMDGDGDVDLSDFGTFLSCFNGPTQPLACQD